LVGVEKERCTWLSLNLKRLKRAEGMAQVQPCLPSKCKALNSNSSMGWGRGAEKEIKVIQNKIS
jgi:hypothetical protein